MDEQAVRQVAQKLASAQERARVLFYTDDPRGISSALIDASRAYGVLDAAIGIALGYLQVEEAL